MHALCKALLSSLVSFPSRSDELGIPYLLSLPLPVSCRLCNTLAQAPHSLFPPSLYLSILPWQHKNSDEFVEAKWQRAIYPFSSNTSLGYILSRQWTTVEATASLLWLSRLTPLLEYSGASSSSFSLLLLSLFFFGVIRTK